MVLQSLVSPFITGSYDFWYLSFALPTAVVAALLPQSWTSTSSPFLNSAELAQRGIAAPVPAPPAGCQWVNVQAGYQINTGVDVSFGKSSFYEAKVEVPFLQHPYIKHTAPLAFKSTVLFSSLSMTASSELITGLRSRKTTFENQTDTFYRADGWLTLEDGSDVASRTEAWSRDLVRETTQGWFVGQGSGFSANKFTLEPKESEQEHAQVSLQLNLPRFLAKSIQETRTLLADSGVEMNDSGWIRVASTGWKLFDASKLESKPISKI
ncbi:hypothetical protein OIV83_000848 [Microbotryomycetes sp. JL201]|nr:hypothetical protein OIV83_000848 [Microbotryomycetes sp. JL201]